MTGGQGGKMTREHCASLNATVQMCRPCPQACDGPPDTMCWDIMLEGCYCAEGHVREHYTPNCGPVTAEGKGCGRCILAEDCPSTGPQVTIAPDNMYC